MGVEKLKDYCFETISLKRDIKKRIVSYYLKDKPVGHKAKWEKVFTELLNKLEEIDNTPKPNPIPRPLPKLLPKVLSDFRPN